MFRNLCLVQGLRAYSLPVNVLGSSFSSGVTPLDPRRGGDLRCHHDCAREAIRGTFPKRGDLNIDSKIIF